MQYCNTIINNNNNTKLSGTREQETMNQVHDVPVDVVLTDHHMLTFQKVRNKELQEQSCHHADSLMTESSYESTTTWDDESSSITTTPSSHVSDEVPFNIKLLATESKIDYFQAQVQEADAKLRALTLQLGRATSSEHALAIAVHDIESQRLALQDYFMEKKKTWKNLPQHKEQEMRAEIEKDFMNEITRLTRRMEDMNRSHNLLMRSKDKEIEKLKEKVKQWDKISSEGDQVFYSS
mmetsp:Transcript_561/g.1019  ORF Transcript_561/g.1019 Transcript_561/m.1019 type:complete len:237 (+) Transcript_561:755-1465(+)